MPTGRAGQHYRQRIAPEESAMALAIFAPNNNDRDDERALEMTTKNALAKMKMFGEDGELTAAGKKSDHVLDEDGFVGWDAVGVRLEGIYKSRTPTRLMDQTDTFNYLFDGIDGDTGEVAEIKCHGTTKLDRLMAKIEPGAYVGIAYIGDVKTSNNFTMKDFDVFVKTL